MTIDIGIRYSEVSLLKSSDDLKKNCPLLGGVRRKERFYQKYNVVNRIYNNNISYLRAPKCKWVRYKLLFFKNGILQ